ncbi:hypothetical protein DES45_104137 [Microvirga subterranea]|uniref:Uncharacterized protein n=1 Tax=Microvirga subterranea TaxID=186651 RepID=A0A370HKV4_9HYPH|nr:hypothetical protein DES45_104137 [Microvirga subterranea]
MNLTSSVNWVYGLNVAAACVSLSFICAVVVGVF